MYEFVFVANGNFVLIYFDIKTKEGEIEPKNTAIYKTPTEIPVLSFIYERKHLV